MSRLEGHGKEILKKFNKMLAYFIRMCYNFIERTVDFRKNHRNEEEFSL